MMKKQCAYVLALMLMLVVTFSTYNSAVLGAYAESPSDSSISSEELPENAIKTDIVLEPYTNLRDQLIELGYALCDDNEMFIPNEFAFERNQYKPEDIYTYNFDTYMRFVGSESVADSVLEEGKNPGMGIRALHAQGITGENVNVAIIDQNLLVDHPEYADRIVAYYDSGCNAPESEGSMHGPAVTSLLAGKSMGVAPGVNVYYAAAPSWEGDAAYFADCLYWIIEQNKELPEESKIRLVSVSSAPEDGLYINSELWSEAVEAASREGIFVVDCRYSDRNTGFTFSSFYDRDAPDDVTKSIPGYPDQIEDDFSNEYYACIVFAPVSYRIRALEYRQGDYRYAYDGVGGHSWSVPYVAGVMALGFQVRPDLSGEEMKALLFETSWVNDLGCHFVNPPAFIEAVRSRTKAVPDAHTESPSDSATSSAKQPDYTIKTDIILEPYAVLKDLRVPNTYVFERNQYKPEDIYTYNFYTYMRFVGSESVADSVLEEGKNPGLGIRALHAQGITGENVNVAIIDQKLLVDHPEYTDRIVAYYDSGCETPESEGSMHGPAVVSLLAGKSIGVAPGANVYYAAAPSGKGDAAYYADCLNWVIEQNKVLPAGNKIRLVSVSSAPQSDMFKNGELWVKAVEAASREGIFVLDCRPSDRNTGFVFSSFYDHDAPEDVTKSMPGYPGQKAKFLNAYPADLFFDVLFAPASYRTRAVEFSKGDYQYAYDGTGGRSWSVPYVAGVMALGFQVRPDLSGEEMKALLFKTSWTNVGSLHFVNPPAFIEAVRGLPK